MNSTIDSTILGEQFTWMDPANKISRFTVEDVIKSNGEHSFLPAAYNGIPLNQRDLDPIVNSPITNTVLSDGILPDISHVTSQGILRDDLGVLSDGIFLDTSRNTNQTLSDGIILDNSLEHSLPVGAIHGNSVINRDTNHDHLDLLYQREIANACAHPPPGGVPSLRDELVTFITKLTYKLACDLDRVKERGILGTNDTLSYKK
jgi:hypothetical protein